MSDRFMMAELTLADILAVLAPGRSVANGAEIVVDHVCIDSRSAEPGSLFIALQGENVDGHDYVGAAVASGARIALVEHPIEGMACLDTLGAALPSPVAAPLCVRVASTLGALQALAAARRRQLTGLEVIGITGSVGKTTAKEAVAAVLSTAHCVLKSGGNRNNEIGLPLTLMTARPEHRFAVLEMGMYALGEIADLCRIAAPQAGLVTNVEPIHLERLGTIERIAQAKAELVEAIPQYGWVALNADDPRVMAMAGLTSARTISFGSSPDADVRVKDSRGDGLEGTDLVVALRSTAAFAERRAVRRVRTRMLGPAAVPAALAGITAGLTEGLGWEQIEQGLEALGQGLRLVTRPGRVGSTILDDTYNASPASVAAALQLLSQMHGKRIAVLGDMLELGVLEYEGHCQIGRIAAESCDLLVTVGERSRQTAQAALEAGMPAEDVWVAAEHAGAIQRVIAELGPGVVVLVKGSRSMRMEAVVAALQEVVP